MHLTRVIYMPIIYSLLFYIYIYAYMPIAYSSFSLFCLDWSVTLNYHKVKEEVKTNQRTKEGSQRTNNLKYWHFQQLISS